MKILMMTNTYKPIVGGLERSVEMFTEKYRKLGHKVLIITPEAKGAPKKEKGVLRVPAIKNFNQTEFSIYLTLPMTLAKSLTRFKPDLIHSHHPFLIGDAAYRLAQLRKIPLVFTHHTLYYENTHYLPGDSRALKRFVESLSRGYENLCDQVFVPSESIKEMLSRRRVRTPIDVVPTGIEVGRFSKGDGTGFKKTLGISPENFVVGYIGRIAPEKNLPFLAKAVASFLQQEPRAVFLVVGGGPSLSFIEKTFKQKKLSGRLFLAGVLKEQKLIDAYHALDVFAFSSHSETQGLVLTEAMAAGVPVVGVDAPGVREVVVDRQNGRLLPKDNVTTFAAALKWLSELPDGERQSLKQEALKTAERFSIDRSVKLALSLYEKTIDRKNSRPRKNPLVKTARLFKAEWRLLVNMTKAAGAAMDSSRKLIKVRD